MFHVVNRYLTYYFVKGSEDKLWADVDKDIGELLREVDPQGNDGSDDEDDLDRYNIYIIPLW